MTLYSKTEKTVHQRPKSKEDVRCKFLTYHTYMPYSPLDKRKTDRSLSSSRGHLFLHVALSVLVEFNFCLFSPLLNGHFTFRYSIGSWRSLAYRTRATFSRFLGEQRQAQSGRGARDRRDGERTRVSRSTPASCSPEKHEKIVPVQQDKLHLCTTSLLWWLVYFLLSQGKV